MAIDKGAGSFHHSLGKAAVLVAVFGIAFWFAQQAAQSPYIQQAVSRYGYGGIYAVSVFSGFNFVVPVPAIAFLPVFLESGLNFWAILIFITLGMATADAAAFYLGRAGRELAFSVKLGQRVQKLEALKERYYWGPIVVLFVFAAFAPLPNEILAVPLGFLGYRFRHLLPAMLAGSFVFNLLYAQGVINLYQILVFRT